MPDYELAVQTVVFADRTVEDLLPDLATTGIDRVEVDTGHLSASTPETEITGATGALAAADVSVVGHGVVDLDGPDDVAQHVAFADRLGADYLAVNYPPDRDDVTEELCARAAGFGVDVAIHNYSSVHFEDLSTVFSSVAEVREVLDRHDHPRLGCCLDTGHFLVEDVDPEAAVRELGDRVTCVHLKDTSEAEREDLPGAGRLDVAGVVDLLDAHVGRSRLPLVIEYELPADRAAAALREAEANVRAAIE
jgi:sugar phosphate isomerase/epimerase